MSILFMGSEMTAFVPSDGSGIETIGAANFDAAFSRAAVRPGNTTGIYSSTPTLALPDEFYTHFLFRYDGASSLDSTAVAMFASGTEVFRVERSGSGSVGTLQMKALISGSLANVGSPVTFDNASQQHVDLYIDGNNASGTATLFIAGTERTTDTADLSSVTGIDEVRFYFGSYVSQVVIADEPTIGFRVLTRYPAAAGTTSDWTGGASDVDEAVYDDADFCNTSTSDAVEQFTNTGPAIDGYSVRAVGVYARAKRGGTGPSNLQLGLRASGTDYFSASKALSVGYSAYGEIWETNPATSAAWVNTAIDTLQPSIKAVT